MAAAVATGSKVGGKWIPPLPHGWEARYDSENKAYFFIDHVHKKTQWDDPRFESKPQAQAQAPSAAAAASGSVGFPRRHEATLTNEVDAALVNKLKGEFPNATKELITDMLVLCHNNERQTREQLKDLGFFVNNATSGSSNHMSPHKKASVGAAPTNKSPDKQHPQAPAASATSPTRKEISEVEKRKLLVQVKELFPKLDQNVIRLALIECHFNLEEVKPLLSAWEKNYGNGEPARGASAGSGDSSIRSFGSSARSFSPSAGSLEPRGLDEDNAEGQRTSQSSTQSPSHTLSPKRTTGGASVTQMLSKGDAVSYNKSSCSQHARAKQVTKMSEHLLNTTSDLLNHLATTASCCTNSEDVEEREDERQKKVEAEAGVADDEDNRPKQPPSVSVSQPTPITTQPAVGHTQKTTSQHRTEAKGPDASLRKGPDITLLTSDYTQAVGPDKSLHHGPDRSYRRGPQAAMGPDVSLRCGPQSAILQENRNNSITTATGAVYSHI